MTDLVIPRQKQTEDYAVMTDEDVYIEFILDNDRIVIGWVLCIPQGHDLRFSEESRFTAEAYQSCLAEAISIVVAPSNGAPKFRVLHVVKDAGAQHKEAREHKKWKKCTHVQFTSRHAVNVTDLR